LAAFPGLDDFPDDATEENTPDYSGLFGVPDYASFVKHKSSAQAQDDALKVKSMLKSALKMALNNGDVPDAAAILKHGEGFAEACGDLSDVSPIAHKAISILTAPDNPYFTFTLMAIGFGSQLLRNHQPEVETAKRTWRERRALKKQMKANGEYVKPDGKPPVRIKLPFGRSISVRFRITVPVITPLIKGISSSTVPPHILVNEVFNDDKLQAALKKNGYVIGRRMQREETDD
jgi:hypothetical protein